MRNNKIVIFAGVLLLLMTGCAPITPYLTDADKREFAKNANPYVNDVIYDQALAAIGEYVNKEISYRKIIQPMVIGNTAGGDELPFNLTNMVITSLSRLAGKKLIVAPYDPEYINNDAITGGRGSRILPDLIVAGSITEFDKDIDATENDIDLDILLDHGKPNTNFGFGFTGSKKMSRITLDLYLLNYKTHAVIPGVSVTNTVNVLELSKGQDFGFAIYGSGIGIGGRIKHTHGFHRAIRNLVDYSILQLMGKYYNIPYWRALGIQKVDPDVLNSLVSSFSRKNKRKQTIIIQKLLNNYKFDEVRDPETGKRYHSLYADGSIGKKTRAYISKFCSTYGVSASEHDLKKLFVQLITHLPINPNISEKATGTEGKGTTTTKEFYDSLDRVDRVYQIPSIMN